MDVDHGILTLVIMHVIVKKGEKKREDILKS